MGNLVNKYKYKKEPMDIKLKNTKSGIKIPDKFNSKLNTIEESISDPEDGSMEIFQTTKHEEKKCWKNK